MKPLEVSAGLLAVACFIPFAADAQEYRPLQGKYAIAGAHLVDPAPGEKRDRAVMFIEGDAAADMFKDMPQKAVKDQCAGDLVSKSAGNLVCSKANDGKYFCSFAVGLKDGRLLNGRSC
ncbi:hypothetical protein [Mitsuaria sp. GD03876]|uniref:hypothetical protein n=1 Tax=Mitsuaria sp. GD03876 TaxID=2975399 RepID=UPI00244A4EE5|nr:hypothetical protein [Mitsuaria sp. GD03876]MDH0867595.1 hypothetical protein [Mitsuaria sp. GD03876]